MLKISNVQLGKIEDRLNASTIDFIKKKVKALLQREVDESFFDVLTPRFFEEAEALQCYSNEDQYCFFLVIKLFKYRFDIDDGLGKQLTVFKEEQIPFNDFFKTPILEEEFVKAYKSIVYA